MFNIEIKTIRGLGYLLSDQPWQKSSQLTTIMPTFTAKSLRLKLIFWILILLLPVLILNTFGSYFAVNLFTNQANDRALFRMGLAIANQIKEYSGAITVDLATNLNRLIKHHQQEAVYFQILVHKRQYISGDKTLIKPKIYPTKGRYLYYNTYLNDQKIRILAFHLPLIFVENKSSITLLVGEKTNYRKESLQEIIVFFIITQILIILMALLSVSYAIKCGLAPLNKLTRIIESRAPWDTSPIKKINLPTEIQPLIDAMNDLLKKAKESVQLKQQFIANAAHQIKTPLSGLKLQAESALSTHEPAYIKHALKQICFVSNNLARLTQQLLSLARTELSNESKSTLSSTELIELTQEIVADGCLRP